MVKIRLPGRDRGGAAGCVGGLVPSLVALAFVVIGSWMTVLIGRGLLAAVSV